MDNWQGKKVLILGAARQGTATLSYLLKKGALPTVNDIQPAEEFQDLMHQFEGQNIKWVLGEHPISLLDNTDLIVISAGVPLSLPILHEAAHRGIPLTNDSQIFMEAVKSKVIGITGSAGKTTTTILVGEIAKKSAQDNQKVWVGGNIGSPLIASLDEIQPSDLVVLELSSFQLELMSISPSIAAILNITPNHLDRHETMAAYIDAKSQILRFQSSRDTAILNCEDATTMELKPLVRGQLITFGHQPSKDQSVYVESDHLVYQQNSKTTILMPCNGVKLQGEHNLLNALAAGAVAIAAGFSPQAIQAGIESVSSIPHRLEWVREWRGINWYNDSIATAPERTAAAIQSFNQPILLLLGGRDKKLPWKDLSDLIHQKVKKVILFGEAAGLISKAIGEPKSSGYPQFLIQCEKFDEAVRKAAEIAERGDVVLLSPGCTSFDEFHDFEDRGRRFTQLVKELPE